MKHLVTAFLATLLMISAAHAREWQSALGRAFDVYLVQTVENENDEFVILALYYDTEGKTLDDVVNLADSLFEEALIHMAAAEGLSAAVVRFSPPGEVAEDELPPVTADVRYETSDGRLWERVNFPEVPVGESVLFPSSPITPVSLSSGETVNLEPATVLYPDDPEREQLNVRALYPLFVMDDVNGERVMALLWDEVIRAMARQEGVNRVSVAIYAELPQGRFDYRPAYGAMFTKERWERWPTYRRMTDGSSN